MTLIQAYATTAGVILGFMTILWVASLILKNSSIVDIFWGTGFVVANWAYFFLTPDGSPARKWLISLLVTVWGLRLSFYILRRNWASPKTFATANGERNQAESGGGRAFSRYFSYRASCCGSFPRRCWPRPMR